MRIPTVTMHPTFDALSRLADATPDDVTVQRVRRHVLQCKTCRAVVEEITALGDAARAMPTEHAPHDLWKRIEARRATDVELPMLSGISGVRRIRADAVQSARDPRPAAERSPSKSASSTARRILLGGAIVLIALSVGMLAPSRRSLEATGVSRLEFTPSRPVPGGTMTVRYRPAPGLAGAPRLVLAGRFTERDRTAHDRLTPWDDFVDSLATLRPRGDGSYEARLSLPADFLAVQMMVVDSTGARRDLDGGRLWVAIGGTRTHEPSLDALLSAYESRTPSLAASAEHIENAPRQSVSVADSIRRYFPGHPAGWAFYDHFGERKGRFDFSWFFDSAERRYAALDDALWPKQILSVDELAAMVRLAARIEEPEAVAKWTKRFAREHPEDPRALEALAGVLHALELREIPGVADSIRHTLPQLDSMFERSHSSRQATGESSTLNRRSGVDAAGAAYTLAMRYGDSATRTRWAARLPQDRSPFVVLRDSTSSATEATAREIAGRPCERPSGKFALGGTLQFISWCINLRSAAYAHLAKGAVARHELGTSAALADSAVYLAESNCGSALAYRARAIVGLARADTASANTDLGRSVGVIRAMGVGSERLRIEREKSLSVLGTGASMSRFDTVSDSSARVFAPCIARRRAAEQGSGM